VGYRLIGEFRRQFERSRTAQARPPIRWTGAYHALLFHFPTAAGLSRRLRRHAIFAGTAFCNPAS